MRIIREYIDFKRGQEPKKSLEIGKFRKIPISLPMEINEVPPGTYIATSKEGAQVLLKFRGDWIIEQISFWKNPEDFGKPLDSQKYKKPNSLIIEMDPETWLMMQQIETIQKYSLE